MTLSRSNESTSFVPICSRIFVDGLRDNMSTISPTSLIGSVNSLRKMMYMHETMQTSLQPLRICVSSSRRHVHPLHHSSRLFQDGSHARNQRFDGVHAICYGLWRKN